MAHVSVTADKGHRWLFISRTRPKVCDSDEQLVVIPLFWLDPGFVFLASECILCRDQQSAPPAAHKNYKNYKLRQLQFIHLDIGWCESTL